MRAAAGEGAARSRDGGARARAPRVRERRGHACEGEVGVPVTFARGGEVKAGRRLPSVNFSSRDSSFGLWLEHPRA